jgi:ABC-type transporter lipoprotein component MlaA
MFSLLVDIDITSDYATPYESNRAAYLADAEALKKATGPYKAARDAYVAATATFTKSLYE